MGTAALETSSWVSFLWEVNGIFGGSSLEWIDYCCGYMWNGMLLVTKNQFFLWFIFFSWYSSLMISFLGFYSFRTESSRSWTYWTSSAYYSLAWEMAILTDAASGAIFLLISSFIFAMLLFIYSFTLLIYVFTYLPCFSLTDKRSFCSLAIDSFFWAIFAFRAYFYYLNCFINGSDFLAFALLSAMASLILTSSSSFWLIWFLALS